MKKKKYSVQVFIGRHYHTNYYFMAFTLGILKLLFTPWKTEVRILDTRTNKVRLRWLI